MVCKGTIDQSQNLKSINSTFGANYPYIEYISPILVRKLVIMLLILLLMPSITSGYYRESVTFITFDGSEYYYTATAGYSTYYIGETLDIDVELVVDFFGFDSYSFYDIELWIRGEDSGGFTVFEDSFYTGLDIIYDGEGVEVYWDFVITNDFPDLLFILVAADFYEETFYGDEFYEDDWVDLLSITIRDGPRPSVGSSTSFPLVIAPFAIFVLLRRRN